MVEHLLCKQGVIGSSPFTSTKRRYGDRDVLKSERELEDIAVWCSYVEEQ